MEYRGEVPEDFLREMPKTDLHLHLDGSMRLATLIELAKEAGVSLPSDTVEGLKDTVFKDSFGSLEAYLECFKYTVAVLQTPSALERCAYELACDNFDENVIYIEVRFAPQLHANLNMDIVEVLKSVNRGLQRARDEYNERPEVKCGLKPPHEYGIIVCGMRFFTPSFSAYYADFIRVHKHEPEQRLRSLASMALVTAAIYARDKLDLPIVALDIAGPERGYPAVEHVEAFQLAHKHFMSKTVHAGESYGPESIFQAITELHADRIGHGFHLFSTDEIRAEVSNPQKYVENLAQYVAEHRITLEVCLTSNIQTLPSLEGSLEAHAFRKMLDSRISVTICTDNRLMSNTTVTNEYKLAVSYFQLNAKQLKDIVVGGFKRSFFPQSYVRKRAYVRRVINYYEQLEAKYNLPSIAPSTKNSVCEDLTPCP